MTGARGDRDDVFSAGLHLPEGRQLRRTRQRSRPADAAAGPPRRRTDRGDWDEAFAVGRRPAGRGDRASTAARRSGCTWATRTRTPSPARCTRRWSSAALGTRQVFSASTLDQMPKHVALGHMFGSPVAFTVPDLDRTDYLVVIGANPLVSNGSLATAADFPGKLRALRKRGGRLTVIDPARTRTAELADRHIAPRPAPTAALLFAVVHVLFDEGLVAPDLGGIGRPRQRRRRRPRPGRRLRARGRRRALRRAPPTRFATLAREIAAARRRRRSTAESALPQSNSARSAAGWSTSSTS